MNVQFLIVLELTDLFLSVLYARLELFEHRPARLYALIRSLCIERIKLLGESIMSSTLVLSRDAPSGPSLGTASPFPGIVSFLLSC